MKRLPTFSRLILTACAAWCLLSASIASAQNSLVETVSVNVETGVARIRVLRGAHLRDLNRAARAHALTPGLHLSMEQIEELNPGQVISVCFDNLPGERPMMSRSSALYQSCEDYRRAQWLVAGVTYTVLLRPSDASVPSTVLPAEPIVDDGRVDELETEVAELEADLAEANSMLEISTEQNRRLLDELEVATALPPATTDSFMPRNWQLSLLFAAFLVVMGWMFFSEMRKHNQGTLDRALAKQRHRFLAVIDKYKTAYSAMREKQQAFQTRLERLQLRTHHLLAALAGFRKRAHANQQIIDRFQLRADEDHARREQLPTLFHLVDETRREMYRAEQLRERIKMLERWMETVEKVEIPDLHDVYQRMIAEYRTMLTTCEERIEAGEEPRSKLVNHIFALTGIMSDSVEAEGRLERSIHSATLAAAAADGQEKACGDVIRIHLSTLSDMRDRDENSKKLADSLSKRDGELEDAEKALAARIREHERKVADWDKSHEAKKAVDAFATSFTNAKLDELDDVSRRTSELEGEVLGLKRRAITAELELTETNSFLEEVRLEFRKTKELLAEFKKSPLSLEMRIIQLTEYVNDLEKQAGIKRPSLFGDLPAIGYGVPTPKKSS